CQHAANEVAEHCVEEGGGQDQCAAQADGVASNCIAEHCTDTPPPPPSCESECEDHAHDEMQRCIADGGNGDTCEMQAKAVFEECVTLHCGDVPPPCNARCERRASRINDRCLRKGGSADDCSAKAAEAKQSCIDEKCVPPPPDTCAAGCESSVEETRQACIAAGTDEA